MSRMPHSFNVRVTLVHVRDPRMAGGPRGRPEPILGQACVGGAEPFKPGAVHRTRRWGERCAITSGATPREAATNALEALAKTLRHG